jgi:foldase protein PrsA
MPLAPARADAGDTVAVVNGEKITEGQVVAELKARWGYEVREQLISALVVEQEAKKKGLVVTPDEVEAAYQQTKQDVTNRGRTTGQTFEDWLAQNEYTQASYRQFLRIRLLLEKMVKPDIKVTDDDVAKYYEQNKQALTREEAVEVAFIAVGTHEQADKLRADIVAGKITWEKAAKDFNLDPYGRDNGGYFGFIRNGDTNLQKAAFSLPRDNDISQPFEEKDRGWLIVKRLSHQAAGIPPYEQVEKQIRDQMIAALTQRAAQKRLQALLELAVISRQGDLKPPDQQ